jgi:hypothetical protein
MTQDQAGQGAGYVAQDDEYDTAQAQQPGPVTRLKKVASALRGDRGEPYVSDETVPDEPLAGQAAAGQAAGQAAAGPAAAGQPGEAARPAEDSMVAEDEMYGAEQADAARPDERAAVRRDGELRDGELNATGAGGRPAATGAPDGLRPGEATDRLGDFGDIAFGNLLPDADQYTTQWQQVQFRFVDDPQGSVTEAAEIISQVTARLEAAIRERQQAIEERQRAIQERASALRGRWGEGANADTETLRETLRMYRAFMDQLVGMTR